MENLFYIKANRKTGNERFLGLSEKKALTLKNFWQWSASDLISNATRGILAEYLVTVALGLNEGTRNEWGAYDMKTKSGAKIEVKSAAYVQSWYQRKLSNITFNISPTLAWDYKTNIQAGVKKRQADIYIFCLLHHRDKKTINPMDLKQWTFYVVPTNRIEEKCPKRRSITLSKLKQLNPKVCDFNNLKRAVDMISENEGKT